MPKGQIAWNKGKKGLQVGWNRGLTKEDNSSIKGGRPIGIPSHRKSQTYEQEYGTQRATEIRQKQSCVKRQIDLMDFDMFAQPLHKRLRNSSRWKVWRKEVFERDKHMCQKCGEKENLHPHHLIPVVQCIKADMIDLIFDVGNGVTLCKNCHLRTGLHKKTEED